MKSKVHEVIVKVRFDKPTTRAHAVAEFRDMIYGEFYPTAHFPTDPEIMTIKTVRGKPTGRRALS